MLHDDWSICRLMPKAVGKGWIDMQLDAFEQSPQASQTRSLITARMVGSSIVPRLRRRRFSAAQVWS